MRHFKIQRALFTFISMTQDCCLTKEDLKRRHIPYGKINIFHKKSNYFWSATPKFNFEDDLSFFNEDFVSVGNDLESLINRIKTGLICRRKISCHGELQKSYQLSLLSDEKIKKLQSNDIEFLDSFWSTPNVSKSDMIFSRSKCYRRTYIIELWLYCGNKICIQKYNILTWNVTWGQGPKSDEMTIVKAHPTLFFVAKI